MPAPIDLFATDRFVVVSPHLDDAALSLGATIARASLSGQTVTVATVLAGDPASSEPAGVWDRRCGFSSASEAALARRLEDARACEILGAEPVWLPFGDEEHDRGGSDEEIWESLSPALADTDAVLVPGHPLVHPDHAWLTMMLLDRLPVKRIGLYVEQPYAANVTLGRGYSLRPVFGLARLAASTAAGHRAFVPGLPASIARSLSGQVTWHAVRPRREERHLKDEAIRAYGSQFGKDRLGRRLLTRIRLYEAATGGEQVGLPRDGLRRP